MMKCFRINLRKCVLLLCERGQSRRVLCSWCLLYKCGEYLPENVREYYSHLKYGALNVLVLANSKRSSLKTQSTIRLHLSSSLPMKLIIMDPALACKMFFGLGTAVVIGGALIPSFRQQIMNYGSRNTNPESVPRHEPNSRDALSRFLDFIAGFEVPHSYFTFYYLASVGSSVFWAHQILTRGQVFRLLAAHSLQTSSGSMTANQVLLAWTLMSIQGCRRLYESIRFTKPSQSKMWAGLWAVGTAYYIFMGITVWVEGICQYLTYGLPMTNSSQRH
jgi:3-oxo-5-alpha-steroid 4-dehydrogenase 3